MLHVKSVNNNINFCYTNKSQGEKMDDYQKVVISVCNLLDEMEISMPTGLIALTYIISRVIKRAPSDIDGVLMETIETLMLLVKGEEGEDGR